MSELKQAPDDLCFVVDTAFYDSDKLRKLNQVKWIPRVPATLKESKAWLKTQDAEINWHAIDDNY